MADTAIVDLHQRIEESVDLSTLEPHPDNPRQGDVGAVIESVTHNGFYGVIVAQESTRRIIAGNHRWKALRQMGVESAPIAWVDVDDVQARRILIADNRVSDLASYDEHQLAAILQETLAESGTLDGTAYRPEDLDDLLDRLGVEDDPSGAGGNPEPDPVLPRNVWCRLGEVWEIGPHRVICGDSTDLNVYARLFAAAGVAQADMVWSDPPYGVNYKGGTAEALTIENDDLDPDELEVFLTAAFTAANGVCKPGAVWFVAAPAGPLTLAFGVPLRDLGIWRQTLVWVKDRFVLGRSDYHYRHEAMFFGWTVGADGERVAADAPAVPVEPEGFVAAEGDRVPYEDRHDTILVGWKPGAAHHGLEDRTQDTVWEIPRPSVNKEHPCLVPTELVMTDEGWRPIAKVLPGDRVLTDSGRFRTVDAITSTPFDGEVVAVRAAGLFEPTRATGNHPFLIARPVLERRRRVGWDVGWLPAEAVVPGDFTLSPVAAVKPVDPGMSIEQAWAFGFWLAEGSTQRAGHGSNEYPRFTVADGRADLVDAVRDGFPGSTVRVYPNGSGGSVNVLVIHPVGEFLRLGGKYAHGKRIHPEVFGWPVEHRQAVLDGYLAGDGCLIRGQHRAKTVSADLAAGLGLLAESLGYRFSLLRCVGVRKEIEGRMMKSAREFWQMTFVPSTTVTSWPTWLEHEGRRYRLRRVQEVAVERFEGEVWNLVVDDDHTFQAVAGMTHNTMKPIDLIVPALINHTARGEVVLDPFGGSGSTLLAAERCGRRGLAIELDPKYVDVICRRVQEASGILPRLVGGDVHDFTDEDAVRPKKK